MKNIVEAPFVQEMIDITLNMYRQGWDERNGGNISVLLKEEDVKEYLDITKVIRTIPTGFELAELNGRYFLVTGTGKYFKNTAKSPDTCLGIVRLADNGKTAELLWGYSDGGKFTSEFPAHMMSHAARLKVDPENTVILHTHPQNIMAMTFVHPLTDKEFTRTVWGMNNECVVVFPDGIGVLPWMVCGTNDIGYATAEKMHDFRIVVWPNHGIYGAGKTMDEAFGLVETVEKSVLIYNIIGERKVINPITDDMIRQLAGSLNIKFREDFLG